MGLETLESALGYLYRDLGSIQRIAENAGLDASRIALGNTSPATAWHNVLVAAQQDNRLADLAALAIKEHPRNADLAAAWAAYQSASKPAGGHETDIAGTGVSPRPARRRKPPAMSDYRTNDAVRIDQMQRDFAAMQVAMEQRMAALQGKVDMLQTQLATVIDQNKTMLAALAQTPATVSKPTMTGIQLAIVVLCIIVMVLTVVAVVYGGRA